MTAQTQPAFSTLPKDKLKISFLGGLDEVGEKNMLILEWADEAIIIDPASSQNCYPK